MRNFPSAGACAELRVSFSRVSSVAIDLTALRYCCKGVARSATLCPGAYPAYPEPPIAKGSGRVALVGARRRGGAVRTG